MLQCIHLRWNDECDLITDLSEDEEEYLWAYDSGICMNCYEDCSYYEPYLDEEN